MIIPTIISKIQALKIQTSKIQITVQTTRILSCRQKFGRHIVALSLVSIAFLPGCGKNKAETRPPSRLASHLSREEGLAVMKQFDSQFFYGKLTDAEVGALGFDLQKISGLEIAEPSSDRGTSVLVQAYRKLFGSSAAQPLGYLFERIKMIVPAEQETANDDPLASQMVALNLSVPIWLENMKELRRERKHPGSIPSIPGDRAGRIPMNSSRMGYVQLGTPYSTIDDSIFRIGTLIHEARHSDCANGISGSQLDQLLAGGNKISIERYVSIIGNCGYLHLECPATHALAGILGCETGAGWGAYSIEIPFYLMIYHQCTNCSEADRQAAVVAASDAASRIIQVEKLLDGRLGLPNMEQRGYRD